MSCWGINRKSKFKSKNSKLKKNSAGLRPVKKKEKDFVLLMELLEKILNIINSLLSHGLNRGLEKPLINNTVITIEQAKQQSVKLNFSGYNFFILHH